MKRHRENAFYFLVGVIIAFALSACAIFKNNACQALKLAADACPYVIVYLPDGTSEAVPKAKIEEVTAATRAARVGAPGVGAPDGGRE